MELRFVHGNFGNIKYKLQYREPVKCSVATFSGEWQDVPCVEEENEKSSKSCKCGECINETGNFWIWRRSINSNVRFCPSCGEYLTV